MMAELIQQMKTSSLVTLAAAALLTGCNAADQVPCTLIGCVDHGLRVELASPATGPFRIEVRTPGSSTVYVYDCPDLTRCPSGPVFADFFPQSVEITVTTARGTVRRNAQPVYTTSRPNGERCEPLCRRGVVTVPLPT